MILKIQLCLTYIYILLGRKDFFKKHLKMESTLKSWIEAWGIFITHDCPINKPVVLYITFSLCKETEMLLKAFAWGRFKAFIVTSVISKWIAVKRVSAGVIVSHQHVLPSISRQVPQQYGWQFSWQREWGDAWHM